MALIELKNVTKNFTMGSETLSILKNIDLSISEGEFVAITGPSGCGKSTLMNLLGLLDRPSEGEYFLEKKSIKKLSDDELAQLRNQKIGFVFQSFNLLSRATALRNVEMPLVYAASYNQSISPIVRTQMSKAALAKVSLTNRENHRPNELSGGQRQRVAIARSIVNNPKIILGDEPTGNLDSKSGKEILSLFENLNKEGVTVILVTHDTQIAAFAKRQIIMLDGRIEKDIQK